MKTTEEKAKAYDSMFERLKEMYNNNKTNVAARLIYERYFPELAESEDERIRKAAIEFVRQNKSFNYCLGISKEEVIAWLEKQGDQKPVDSNKHIEFTEFESALLKLIHFRGGAYYDIEETPSSHFKLDAEKLLDIARKQILVKQKPVVPKFKVGDWIIDIQGVSVNQIIGDEDDSYLIKTSCSQFYLPMKLTEKNYRLWTIQDAKDGDVLSWDNSKCIALFKSIYDEDSFNSHGLIGHCTGTFEPRQAYHDIEGAHPATKEQRETLMKAMADAGYTFDFEKKELKKIEQKPAWSEEDEKQARQIERIVHNDGCTQK